jgi:hypothetical protein
MAAETIAAIDELRDELAVSFKEVLSLLATFGPSCCAAFVRFLAARSMRDSQDSRKAAGLSESWGGSRLLESSGSPTE